MDAHRILSLLPSTTEIAGALGLADQLVGRSHECTLPAGVERLPVVTAPKLDVHAPSRAIDRRVKELVREGLSVYRVDAERVRALRPTIVLTQTQCDVCAVTPADLEAAACEWIGAAPRIVSVAPNALADVLGDVVRVADACGVPARGAALRAREQERIETISAITRAHAERSGRRPRVASLEWIDPVMGAGNWLPELIERAGGESVLGRGGHDAAWSSLDELTALDPDVLVVAPCGFDLPRGRAELPALASQPAFAALRAVREGRAFLADGFLHFNRPGPRIAETLEIYAEMLWPDACDFGRRGAAFEPL
ncbi:MAG: cobalamin-binding protein [Proteobacteria bacterium]|nr:MAG: cobalamin-binding protein [Pseudomonadota bacterium]